MIPDQKLIHCKYKQILWHNTIYYYFIIVYLWWEINILWNIIQYILVGYLVFFAYSWYHQYHQLQRTDSDPLNSRLAVICLLLFYSRALNITQSIYTSLSCAVCGWLKVAKGCRDTPQGSLVVMKGHSITNTSSKCKKETLPMYNGRFYGTLLFVTHRRKFRSR